MELFTFISRNKRWLAAGGLLTFASSFGQTFFISIFAGDIQAEFDLSHGDWGALYSAGTLGSGLLMIWAGGLADRFRARTLAAAMMVGLAAVALAMAGNRWAVLLPFIIFGLRFTGQGMLSHIAIVAMARWFVAARGKAISLATLGYAIGEACLPLSFVALLPIFGWRALWVVAALASLAMVPIILRLLASERTPQSQDNAQDAAGMGGRHWTRAEVLCDPRFYALIPVVTANSIFITALFFQQVHLAEVKGWAHLELVALFPIYTGVSILSAIGFGLAIDRWNSISLLPLSPIPIAFGFLALSQADALWVGVLVFFLCGVSAGINITVNSAFWPEAFGTKNVGSIKALATSLMVLGSAVGPVITGLAIDAGWDFDVQTTPIGIYMLLTGFCTFFVTRSVRRDIIVSA